MLVAVSLIASSSWAERPSESESSSAPDAGATPSGPVVSTDGKVPQPERVDPQGITGISPYRQLINRADSELLARSLDEADAIYRQAVASSPREPLGHLRMAELALKREKWSDAEESIGAALRFSQGDRRAELQARFLLAVLYETVGKLEEAAAAWKTYQEFSTNGTPTTPPGKPPAPTTASGPMPPPADKQKAAASSGPGGVSAPLPPRIHTATSVARLEAIHARQKLNTDYAAVKERIQKNIGAAEAVTGGGTSK